MIYTFIRLRNGRSLLHLADYACYVFNAIALATFEHHYINLSLILSGFRNLDLISELERFYRRNEQMSQIQYLFEPDQKPIPPPPQSSFLCMLVKHVVI